MISEKDEIEIQNKDYKQLEKVDKIVIAETGQTAFNIRSLKMNSVVSPNSMTDYMLLRTLTIEIYEPLGFSFYDKLISAAFILGIRDILRFPLYLEISFKGYVDGVVVDLKDLHPYDEFDGKWIFKIMITDVDVTYDNRGSAYKITAVPYADLGKADLYSMLGRPLNVQARKVEDVFQAFVEAKMKEEFDHYNRVRNIYSFEIKEIPKNAPKEILDLIESKSNPATWELFSGRSDVVNRKRSTSLVTHKEFNFSKGQHIKEIVKEVFANTVEGQRLIAKTKDLLQQQQFSKFGVVWLVDTEVTIRNDNPYDFDTRDYNRHIKFIIHPYITTLGILSRKQLVDMETGDSNAQKEKLLARIRTGRLVKKYDYFHTGLNIDVMNVTMNFDHFYKAIISLYGNMSNEFAVEPQELEQDNYLPRRSESGFSNPFSKYTQMFEIVRSAKANPSNPDRENTTTRYYSSKETVRNEYIREKNITSVSVTRDREEERRKIILQKLGMGNTNVIYLEDLKNTNMLPTNRLLHVMIDRSVRDEMVSKRGSIEPENPLTTSVTLSILNQIQSKSMMEISLTIKGDPYWLGIPTSKKYIHVIDQNIPAPYEGGNIFILFRMKVPVMNDDTGEPVFLTDRIFTGIYIPVEVESEFNDGMFIQHIKAKRDVTIDITFIKNLDEF